MLGIFSWWKQRGERSIHNPQIPLEQALELLSSGYRSTSGVNITHKTVLGYPAFWRGINLIARGVAKVPVFPYRYLQPKGKELDRNHPSYRVLRIRPNSEMGPFIFKQTLQAHTLAHGNGFAAIVRRNSGDVEELLILDPQYTCAKRDDKTNKLYYKTMIGNQEYEINPEDILHIRGLGYDGLTGYSVVDILRESLGLGMAMQRYGSVFFRNNARPSIALQLKGRMKDEEAIRRLRASWNTVHGGIEDSHKPAILEDGTELKTFSFNNEDAQFLQSREFELIQVANILQLPPHKLGHSVNTSYKSLEQENQGMLDDCYEPWFVTWEEEIEEKLLRENERELGTHTIEFKRQALMRADAAARSAYYDKMLTLGVYNTNEVRDLEDVNPREDGKGDKYYIPSNVRFADEPAPGAAPQTDEMPADEPAEEPQDEEEDEPRNTLPIDAILREQQQAIRRDIDRHFRRVTEALRRASQKPQSFMSWLDVEMEKHHRAAMEEDLRPHIKTCVLLTRGSTGGETTTIVERWFTGWRSSMLELSGTVTADQLERAVADYVQEYKPETFVSCLINELQGCNDAA